MCHDKNLVNTHQHLLFVFHIKLFNQNITFLALFGRKYFVNYTPNIQISEKGFVAMNNTKFPKPPTRLLLTFESSNIDHFA